jgi:hypothetical protein
MHTALCTLSSHLISLPPPLSGIKAVVVCDACVNSQEDDVAYARFAIEGLCTPTNTHTHTHTNTHTLSLSLSLSRSLSRGLSLSLSLSLSLLALSLSLLNLYAYLL